MVLCFMLHSDSSEEESEMETSTSSQSGGSQSDCDSHCCQDTHEASALQIRDAAVLRRTKRNQGHSRQFCADWYGHYPWLALCVTRLKAFCAYCRYVYKHNLLTDRSSESAFITTGYNNWKKALQRFDNHSKSGSHKEAVLKIQQLKRPSVVTMLDSSHKNSQKVHRDMLLRILSSLKFLLQQGLAIRGHEEMEGNLMQLLLFQSEHCSELKQFIKNKHYLSNDIINEIIALMSMDILRDILMEIREAGMFSLIADEATDISQKEQLCVTIRWLDSHFGIHETPVELIQVPKTDSETLTTVLKDCLIRFTLPISQCRGQAYDGASNMSGHISGVATRIQECEPRALFVHCLAHCTNLCLQKVGSQVMCVYESLNLVMELSRFSLKRSSLFATLQAQVSSSAPTLKPLCPTRWTVRTRAIEAVLANYQLLLDALEEIQQGKDEYALKANRFLHSMLKFSTFFGLKVSQLVFQLLNNCQ